MTTQAPDFANKDGAKLYDGHEPVTFFQKSLLAAGSAIMGLIEPTRSGTLTFRLQRVLLDEWRVSRSFVFSFVDVAYRDWSRGFCSFSFKVMSNILWGGLLGNVFTQFCVESCVI